MKTDSLLALANNTTINTYNPSYYSDKVEFFNEKQFTDQDLSGNLLGGFRPRPYQARSMNFLMRQDAKGRYLDNMRVALCEHRRCGKTIRTINMIKIRAMRQVGVYFLVYPTLNQGRKVIWDGIAYNEQGEGYKIIETIPPVLWKRKDNHLMSLELYNGSVIQIVGAVGTDGTPDHLRGTNPIFAAFDEYAAMNPAAWHTAIYPIFLENGGSAMFTFTPDGKNHAYDLLMDYMARYEEDPGGRFMGSLLTIDDTKRHDGTPVISSSMLEELRGQGVSEEHIQREFYCSFEGSREGSFYAKLLDKCRLEGRIKALSYDPALPVLTAWDIGIGTEDMNVCWVYQIVNANTINFLAYYEFENQGLMDGISALERLPQPVRMHGFPWDVRQKDSLTGLTKLQRLEDAKLTSADLQVVDRVSVADGIDIVRSNFHKFYFDEAGCALGLDRLRKYSKQVVSATGFYGTKPVHDENSHGADGLRTFANMLEQDVLSEYSSVLPSFNMDSEDEFAEDNW